MKDLGERREGWVCWVQRIITTVKLFILCSSGKIYLSTFIKTHRLYNTRSEHQCSFIDYNKCTTLCAMWIVGEAVYYGRMWLFVNWLPIYSAHFCFESKSILKYKVHLRNIILDAVWLMDTHWSETIGPTVYENIRQDRYRDINK